MNGLKRSLKVRGPAYSSPLPYVKPTLPYAPMSTFCVPDTCVLLSRTRGPEGPEHPIIYTYMHIRGMFTVRGGEYDLEGDGFAA